MIAANPKLRAVAAQSITPANIDVAEATGRGIPVTVVPPIMAEATADLQFGLMLAVARRMVEGDRLVRAGKFPGWQSRHLLGAFVHGKTIGLIGGGADRQGGGAARARLLHARALLDAAPQAGERGARARHGISCRSIELLRESDFVSLHSPLNAQTRHLIGAREFSLMKQTAFIINTARGPIIDEAALVRALKAEEDRRRRARRVRARAQSAAELKRMKNVVLKPHLGSAVWRCASGMANIVVDNIEALIDGRTPPNCVNPQVLK